MRPDLAAGWGRWRTRRCQFEIGPSGGRQVFVEGSPDEHLMSCSPSSTQLMSFKPSSVEEEEIFMHVLHRLASLCKARGVLFKQVFFERHSEHMHQVIFLIQSCSALGLVFLVAGFPGLLPPATVLSSMLHDDLDCTQDVDRAPVMSPSRQSPFMGGKVTREQFIRRFPFKKEFPPEDTALSWGAGRRLCGPLSC
eukprot:g31795.t1